MGRTVNMLAIVRLFIFNVCSKEREGDRERTKEY